MNHLSPAISGLLHSVRRRIRRYVWWEGAAVAIIWLAVTFWLGLALDYLPVRMGASEMPRAARVVLLSAISIMLAVILYRYILRRVFAQLRDESIALLLERKFPQFDDSLVTIVELNKTLRAATDKRAVVSDASLQQDMLQQAHAAAELVAPQVNIDQVFDYWPLRRAAAIAGLLTASVLFFAITSWPAFGLWVSRLYGLSEQTYPRRTHLEMDGFAEGTVTVARGSDLSIRVLADAGREFPPPTLCTIYYETSDGERGRVNMSKKGAPRDGFQQYTFDGKPFKSILSDIRFDVVGNDQRIRDQLVRVVDSPQVVSVELQCTRPAYTDLSPTRLEYYPGIKVPRGSKLNVRVTANKPLVQAQLQQTSRDPTAEATTVTLVPQTQTQPTAEETQTPAANQVAFAIDTLNEDVSHEIELLDTDGVRSQRAYRIAIVAVPDFAPNVAVRIRGIGSAITADARIPIEGEIKDDYAVDRSWFEVELSNDETRSFPLAKSSGEIDDGLDLRQQRAAEQQPLSLAADSRIVFSVKSADKYDLDDDANVGQSDRYELQVVSANELIALLEARELGLRRRFEQIVDEMTETRDSLQRVAWDSGTAEDAAAIADELTGDTGTPPASDLRQLPLERAAALRLLRVQRGEQQSQRGAAEVMGVALSFEDVSLELINNRVDANDRVERIERDISTPLRDISEILFPVLDARLERLKGALESDATESEISDMTATSVAQIDEILIAMDAVLSKMLDLETYNELVDLIRSMIKDQDELTERTKSQRKKSALDLLK